MQKTRDDDYDLVRQAQKSSTKAFEVLVMKHRQKVFNHCYFMLSQNRQDAEDAAQEIFCNAWRNIGSFKENSKFSTWLYTLTKNHCLNIISGKKRRDVFEQEPGSKNHDMGTTKPQLVDPVDDCVRQKVNELEEIHCAAITLIHFNELSYEEAADMLGEKVNTLKVRVHRALEKLRPLIRECI